MVEVMDEVIVVALESSARLRIKIYRGDRQRRAFHQGVSLKGAYPKECDKVWTRYFTQHEAFRKALVGSKVSVPFALYEPLPKMSVPALTMSANNTTLTQNASLATNSSV